MCLLSDIAIEQKEEIKFLQYYNMWIVGFICLSCIALYYVLPRYHHHVIMKHLSTAECDSTLYLLVKAAKENIAGTEACRVETSTKTLQCGTKNNGRYTIPVLLSEFQRYSTEHQSRIIRHLGFASGQYRDFIEEHKNKIIPNTDIIFGVDGSKGKLYLDFGAPRRELVCIESTGKKKHYVSQSTSAKHQSTNAKHQSTNAKHQSTNALTVYSGGKIQGYHYPPGTHGKEWTASNVDGSKTQYNRPYLPLIWIRDLNAIF